jgi:hypothetical protein
MVPEQDEPQGAERRIFPRAAVPVMVKCRKIGIAPYDIVHTKVIGEMYQAENISAGGIMVDFPEEAIYPGDHLIMEFSLNGSGRAIKAVGEVVRVIGSKKVNRTINRVALRFEVIDESDRKEIVEAVKRYL